MTFGVKRIARRLSVVVSVLALACSWPTEACGCTPALSHVLVLGTIVDATSAPVSGARVLIDVSLSADDADAYRSIGPQVTDGNGAFRTIVMSPGGAVGWLRARIVRGASTDTIRVRGGQVTTFRYSMERADSVRMTFQVP